VALAFTSLDKLEMVQTPWHLQYIGFQNLKKKNEGKEKKVKLWIVPFLALVIKEP
jgi:hypothetical protein